MTRKEIIFLVANIPLCFILLYLFSLLLPIVSNGKMYVYFVGGYIFVVFCILNLAIDLVILKVIKGLKSIPVLVGFFEVVVFYILFWYWYSNTPF
jgi:hypothetical protein